MSEVTTDRASATAQDRILFVPEIIAFGGGERIYLSLSKFLHERGIPHRIASYYQDIRLQDYADWPLKIELISPDRNPMQESLGAEAIFRPPAGAGGGKAAARRAAIGDARRDVRSQRLCGDDPGHAEPDGRSASRTARRSRARRRGCATRSPRA